MLINAPIPKREEVSIHPAGLSQQLYRYGLGCLPSGAILPGPPGGGAEFRVFGTKRPRVVRANHY